MGFLRLQSGASWLAARVTACRDVLELPQPTEVPMVLKMSRLLKPVLLAAAMAATATVAQAQTVLKMGFGLQLEAHYGVGAVHMQKLVA